MKVLLLGSAVNAAITQALLEKGFDTVDVCSNSVEIKERFAHPNNGEFYREFKQRQKAEQRKAMKKPARGGGKP